MDTSSDIIPYLQKRSSLSTETFLIPISFKESEIVHSLRMLANHILSASSGKRPKCQHKNYRSLITKIHVLLFLFQFLASVSTTFTYTEVICLAEFYVLLNRARDLLNYCLESSRIELLITNTMMSTYFHDLDREILCILDVISWQDLKFSDVAEHVLLMREQLWKGEVFIDPADEALQKKIFVFHEALEAGKVPDYKNLHKYFVEDLGIRNARSWNFEYKCLEDIILREERGVDISFAVLKGFAALMQYSKVLLFGVEEISLLAIEANSVQEVNADIFDNTPSNFLCPISHDLMINPVILTTGQTFDQNSILDWFKSGNTSCPATREELSSLLIIPNKALQSLISKWCAAEGVVYSAHPTIAGREEYRRIILSQSSPMAMLVANRCTVRLLKEIFSQGLKCAQILALEELILLIENGQEICMDIVNVGWVPILASLLKSENDATQENTAAILMYLSVYTVNKLHILTTKGSLKSFMKVLNSPHTKVARGHAIATLFCLSSVPEYTKKIAKERGLLKAMAEALTSGSMREKTHAIYTLSNLAKCKETGILLIKAGCIKVLGESLRLQELRIMAADILSHLVEIPKGAKKIRRVRYAEALLRDMMLSGNSLEQQAANFALIAFLIHGGSRSMNRIFQQKRLHRRILRVLSSDLPEEWIEAAEYLSQHERSMELDSTSHNQTHQSAADDDIESEDEDPYDDDEIASSDDQ